MPDPHADEDWLRDKSQELLRRAREDHGVDDRFTLYPVLVVLLAEHLAVLNEPDAETLLDGLRDSEVWHRSGTNPMLRVVE